MKIELLKEDAGILFALVFLGDWLVNSYRMPDSYLTKYKKVAEKIQKLHKHILSPEEKKAFDNDALQFYLNRFENFIDDYDNESCFATLAQKLSEANYPENPQSKSYYDSINIQLDAQAIYLKDLNEKGVSIILVDIPDIDDRLEICRQALKKKI